VTSGRIRGKRRYHGPWRYLPGGWSDDTVPVHAYAVAHPDGVCLFDTGQTVRAARPGYHPRWHPYFKLARCELDPEDEIASQIDAQSVRWVLRRDTRRARARAPRPSRRRCTQAGASRIGEIVRATASPLALSMPSRQSSGTSPFPVWRNRANEKRRLSAA
jgi:hypothetical protein